MQEEVSGFAAFVGIDWADRKHDVCLQVAGADAVELSVLEHRPKAIDDWARALRERFPGRRIAVCLELSHGPIVSALLEHDIFVIFPVNPSTLAKYRRAFTPSRAKDDPTDAAIALELLVRHREKLKPLRHESPHMRALRRLVESRRDLVQDRVRLTNRLTFTLKAYFPPGSRPVSRQRDRGLRRVSPALAVLARRPARSTRDHRRLLSRPQRPSR
jgi:transposase